MAQLSAAIANGGISGKARYLGGVAKRLGNGGNGVMA